jgi:uncharacterized protein YdiU (UPF0061 family)
VTVTAPTLFALEDTFVRELEGLYLHWRGAEVPDPRLLVLNEPLAAELGADPAALRAPEGVAVLAGSLAPGGATTVAQAYAGHQFGGYSPRLGDGRALLLGEVVDVHGNRRDLHLKGSGRTPFSRGGDGKAVVGPMLREYLISEAMHALGVPTTRALAVVATGEQVVRETLQPGAVLTRVAASHLRVGTFQYAAATGDRELLRRLADYAIARHHPGAAEADDPYLALFEAVVAAQAALLAQWMLVGFVHGVMNTDNMTISGETIDYGPCAFMDVFDPATVFSSIDHTGRYAYGNQPTLAQWNLARFAETLLGLIDADTQAAADRATEVLGTFTDRFNAHWYAGMRGRLGLTADEPEDKALVDDFAAMLYAQRVDYTTAVRGVAAGTARDHFVDLAAYDAWDERRRARPLGDPIPHPVYIPRNHLVEEALVAASAGDLAPFERLLDVLSDPYTKRPGLERYAEPDPDAARYVTFCGT